MCCLPFLSSYGSFSPFALVFETWTFTFQQNWLRVNTITGHQKKVEATTLCAPLWCNTTKRMDGWMDRLTITVFYFFSCNSHEPNLRPYTLQYILFDGCSSWLSVLSDAPYIHVWSYAARWLTYNSTVCRLGGNEAPGHVCHVPSAKLCWCLDAWDGDWSCIANESGGSWQCSKLLQDWLKVFRVGGAACGCSVGTGNPWQTLPLLLSALMESEESLEVASVSSTPPQKQTLSFSTSMPRLLTLHPPGATPILSWSLFISSVSGLRVLPLVNRLCLESNEQWWNVLLLYIHIHVLSWLNYLYSNAILFTSNLSLPYFDFKCCIFVLSHLFHPYGKYERKNSINSLFLLGIL